MECVLVYTRAYVQDAEGCEGQCAKQGREQWVYVCVMLRCVVQSKVCVCKMLRWV